ncbi:hypothetical protein AB9F41_35340, partial [Rhizobium leguminosarum]
GKRPVRMGLDTRAKTIREFTRAFDGAVDEVMRGAGLFINTTSLGMDGEPAPQLDFSPLAADAVVTDIVYVPLKTPILAQAEEQGFP